MLPPAGNVLTSGAGWSYEYDAEGKQTRKVNSATGETVEYAWDYRNRLIEVRKYDASHVLQQSVGFAYDALNQRIAKVCERWFRGGYGRRTLRSRNP